VEKASASGADAVFIDLEDAVPVNEKPGALRECLKALHDLDWGQKHVAVRVNAVGSPTIDNEIRELSKVPRLDAVILPKAELPADVSRVAEFLSSSSALKTGAISVELLIETALGIVNVDVLAAAHANVSGLHFGVGDFTASIGARTTSIGISPNLYRHASFDEGLKLTSLDLFGYPMMRILVAARARGIIAIDGPYGNYSDLTSSRLSAEKAASMGFDGKQIIHPTQIVPTHEAFLPTGEELIQANRVLSAMADAEKGGLGATTVDGKMIDAVSIKMARRILAYAR